MYFKHIFEQKIQRKTEVFAKTQVAVTANTIFADTSKTFMATNKHETAFFGFAHTQAFENASYQFSCCDQIDFNKM